MDHLTLAQLLGSYGEFMGSIVVLATLVYVGVQTRQNTRVWPGDDSYRASRSSPFTQRKPAVLTPAKVPNAAP